VKIKYFSACTASFSFKSLNAFAQARPAAHKNRQKPFAAHNDTPATHTYPKFALLKY
jgi:hypothetical protein